ncbi:hypothetical protein V6O07_23085, partial [Arthrospira platensis SPKY2]
MQFGNSIKRLFTFQMFILQLESTGTKIFAFRFVLTENDKTNEHLTEILTSETYKDKNLCAEF